ncbi:MAG: MFS transporter [Candidatus Lokiarchaeota archaeon]|nr:MFS transporter [Candidatus Lokiarchaeota archaeon]
MKLSAKLKDATPVKLDRGSWLMLGLLGGGGAFFGTVENGQLNTYINGVLRFEFGAYWDWWMIPLMTSFSALMGLVFMLVWGAVSDRHYSRWGHRRPFLLLGVVAGAAMIVYLASRDFWLCFFIDVVVIGIFMNGRLAAEKALLPDLTEPAERGRVNARVNVVSAIFGIVSMAFFLLAAYMFSVPGPDGDYMNYAGHAWVLVISGVFYIGVAIAGFMGIKERARKPEQAPPGNWYSDIVRSFRFSELKEQREFFKIMMAMLVFNIGPKIFLPWIFEFLTRLLDLITLWLVISVAAIYLFGGWFISLLLGKLCDRYGRKRPAIMSIILGSIGFLIVPLAIITLNFALILIMFFLLIFVLNGVPTITSAWMQDLLPAGKIGQFTGINNISSTVNQFIGVWIGGVVYLLTGGDIAWNMFIAAFVFLASIPLFFFVKESLAVKDVNDR